jgi:hypothetical protein
VAAPLAGQENRPWPERSFVAINVPFQPLNNDFSESLSFTDTVRRTENVDFLMQYPSTRGVLFDIGGGIRLATSLGVGVTASWLRGSNSGSFELKVPNPLVANSPLELTDSVSELDHSEVGVHIHVLYARALGRNVRVILSGGPSIFNTKQDLVRSIEFDILPGFRSLQLDQAVITEDTQTSFGFNAGADLTWTLASHLGIGTLTRFSRANLTWTPGSESGLSRAIRTHAGGLHVGGGIRLLF